MFPISIGLKVQLLGMVKGRVHPLSIPLTHTHTHTLLLLCSCDFKTSSLSLSHQTSIYSQQRQQIKIPNFEGVTPVLVAAHTETQLYYLKQDSRGCIQSKPLKTSQKAIYHPSQVWINCTHKKIPPL